MIHSMFRNSLGPLHLSSSLEIYHSHHQFSLYLSSASMTCCPDSIHSKYPWLRLCCSVSVCQISGHSCLYTEPKVQYHSLFHNYNSYKPDSSSVVDCPCTALHTTGQLFQPYSCIPCSLGSARMLGSDRSAVVGVCLLRLHCDKRCLLCTTDDYVYRHH